MRVSVRSCKVQFALKPASRDARREDKGRDNYLSSRGGRGDDDLLDPNAAQPLHGSVAEVGVKR